MVKDTTKDRQLGNSVRASIRDKFLKNMYVINLMVKAGFEMSEAKFSNKLGGERDSFTEDEIKKINEILETDFSIG